MQYSVQSKVLNCGIGFQDFENALNLAKMCLKFEKVWKF